MCTLSIGRFGARLSNWCNGMMIGHLFTRFMMRKFSLKWTLLCSILISLIVYTVSLQHEDKCEKNADGVGCKVDENRYSADKNKDITETPEEISAPLTGQKVLPLIQLSVVSCGDRLQETLVMIKSAVLFVKSHVHVHIFADDESRPQFQQQLESWPQNIRSRLGFTLYPIQFPEDQDAQQWKQLFKTCASQRLFIPDILKDVSLLLYVDTDVLFLRPIDDIWQFFAEFNETHIAALAPEHEEPTASWYARFARHPYVPPYGVNSGVMLMNLTRMRQLGFIHQIIEYHQKHKYDITWGDQDLINIFFHFFPEKLYQYACKWNYRPDHCMYMSNCKSAEADGVSVLHGCRSSFQNEKQPAFKAVYQAIRDHPFEADLHKLLISIKDNMKSAPYSQCGNVRDIFVKQLEADLVQP